jgi:DNA-binding NarL/FixJ family response regulator
MILVATEARAMKILLVDDHDLIRDALAGVLREIEPGAQILDAPSGRLALDLANGHGDLDLVLLDLVLPDASGFDLLDRLREQLPSCAVVVLSASEDRADIARALDLGALGFIPKRAPRAVMISALKLVFAGGIYVPPEILSQPQRRTPAPPAAALTERHGLTGRQADVLTLMMQGKSNKAIGRVLDLAEPTVKNHVTAILKALRATNRTEAVLAAGGSSMSADPGLIMSQRPVAPQESRGDG